MVRKTCLDPRGGTIITMAVEAGFDLVEVEDDEARGHGIESRPRTLLRMDTEEELRRVKLRREVLTLKKQLHEQEVEDDARSRCEVSEVSTYNLGVSIRVPKAPRVDSTQRVLWDVLPPAALQRARGSHFEELTEASISSTRQAEQAHLTPPSGHGETHPESHSGSLESLVSTARQAQRVHLAPQGGPGEKERSQGVLTDSQAMQNNQATAECEEAAAPETLSTRAVTEATAEQVEGITAQAMKRVEEDLQARVAKKLAEAQAKQMKEFEAQVEARMLKEAESHMERTKELKESSEARTLQEAQAHTEQMKELAAQVEARSTAALLKEAEARAEARAEERFQAQMEVFQATRMREFEAQAEARASQRTDELQEQLRQMQAHADAQATLNAEAQAMQMNKLRVEIEERAAEKAEVSAVQGEASETEEEVPEHSPGRESPASGGTSPKTKRPREQ